MPGTKPPGRSRWTGTGGIVTVISWLTVHTCCGRPRQVRRGRASAQRWVTKAPGVPYPRLPGAIVVAINPGHGGSDPGAIRYGTRESDVNLDIALRVRRMLQGAGITVVMTRVTDVDVNRPAIDRNGDGRVDHTDELIARNDVANTRAGRPRAQHPQQRDGLPLRDRAPRCSSIGSGRGPPRTCGWARTCWPAIVRRLRAFQSAWLEGPGPGHRTRRLLLAPSPRPTRRAGGRRSCPRSWVSRCTWTALANAPGCATQGCAPPSPRATSTVSPSGWRTRRFGIRYSDIQAPDRVVAGGDATVRLRIHEHRQRQVLALAPGGPGRAPRAGAGRLGHSWSPRGRGGPARRHRTRRRRPTSRSRSTCPPSGVSGC